MRKTWLVGALLLFLAAISSEAALIKVEPGFGPFQVGQGGEFTVLPTGVAFNGYVGGITRDLVEPGTFQTFCLELRESLSAGTFEVTISDRTKLGGIILNKGTAWLYDTFRDTSLGGYDFGAGRLLVAGKLQNEIWWLMGNGGAPDPLFDPLVNAAALSGGWNKLDPNAGFFPVAVLNLWAVGQVDTREGARQDLLVATPRNTTPDGGLTLALMGMGLLGVGYISRHPAGRKAELAA